MLLQILVVRTKLYIKLCPTTYEDNMFRPFGFIALKALNYLAFQSLDFERT